MGTGILTVKQLAEKWQLNPHTIYNWVASEKIPFHRFGNKTIRFKEEEVEDWSQKKGSEGRIREGRVN